MTVGPAGAQNAALASRLLPILESELKRNFEALKAKADPPPYFLAYSVTESETQTLVATQGALYSRNANRNRTLDISVRVGTPQLDNYRRLDANFPQFSAASALALDDNEAAIRQRLWLDTDRTYRLASQRLLQVKSNLQTRVDNPNQSDDFSKEEPVQYDVPPPALQLNTEEWSVRLRQLSKTFSNYPGILDSNVSLLAIREVKHLVNTEGTRVRHGRSFVRVLIVARGKAADGMDLAVTDTFDADEPGRLPKMAVMEAAVERAAKDLTALLRAPVVDPFVGPAILSGRAAGVFFHEIFGHRIEGHRQKDESEGQTFTKSLNQPVLPDFLSIVFDPTRKQVGGIDLSGTYLYDDEGVKARPVTLVEKGVLRTFLLSRTPVPGFARSNGHGRKQPGAEVVSRQSNLIVESAKQVPEEKLREMLRDELKKQNKPFGLYFREVTGGFTTTGRRGLQAYTVIPLVVYRVFADGRPDELVRGADIVGTPLASFAKILATGNQPEVFNGICGAESGSVPVSAVSPSILISEIEIQRKEQSRERPPLLPRPATGVSQ